MMTHPTPPRRKDLGHCLERARCAAGMNQRRAAKQLGIRATRLRAWETGTEAPDAHELERAIHLYGTDLDKIWPDRRPLIDDQEPGVLVVGDDRIDATGTNRQILTAYLDAVRRNRSVEPKAVVELRSQDVHALSSALDLDDAELESLLCDLFQLTPAGARLTMRALAVGALGSIGLTAVLGAAWLGSATAGATTPVGELAAPAVATASPFSVDPSTVEVELAPAVFAVAPATEWSPVEVDEDDSIQVGAGEIGPGEIGVGEIGVGEIEAPSIRADG